MYGYAYGAAKADVWHKWDTFSMIYPGYEPHAPPKLMHYGLIFEVDGYKFDKHWHYGFNVNKCPPWDLSDPKRRKEGLFPHPPRVSTLKNKVRHVDTRGLDILCLRFPHTKNAIRPFESLLIMCHPRFLPTGQNHRVLP